MKIKKIISAAAAAAIAISAMAVSAFAATVELDSEYAGSWGAGKCIPKADLLAIGGDVNVVLTYETRTLLPDQFLIAPMDYDNGWTRINADITGDKLVMKADGFISIQEGTTTCEFVVPAATIEAMGDSGLGFQVQNVIIKSAEITAGSPQAAPFIISDDQNEDYNFNRISYEELTGKTAGTDAAAPATDSGETATASTGNTSAAVLVSVMAVAGMAILTSKKRK